MAQTPRKLVSAQETLKKFAEIMELIGKFPVVTNFRRIVYPPYRKGA